MISMADENVIVKSVLDNRQMTRMLEVSHDGFFTMDGDGRVQFYNEAFYSQFAIDPAMATLQDWISLIHPEDALKFKRDYETHMSSGVKSFKSEYKVATKAGSFLWIEAYGIAEFDSEGKMVSMTGSHRDITRQKINEDRIYQLAYVDGLTGLYNRSKLNELLTMHLTMQSPGAFVYLNINQFKLVNDTYGEETGNRVLIRVAERIKQALNEKCTLFRIHGDEFAILIGEGASREVLVETVERLQQILSGRVTLREKVIEISTSAGICELPMAVAQPEELIQRAKLTMRYGRQLQGQSYAFFDKAIEASVMRELHIETGLRYALESNELYLNYQPVVRADTAEVIGAEALLRWRSEEWGEVYPDQFIPISEKTLEIIEIGKFVLERACEFIKTARAKTEKPMKVSVNVSVVQLVQSNFVEEVLEIVEKVGVSPSAIVLEITESITLDMNPSVMEKLKILSDCGIQIALDDFGTGYSSVNTLMTMSLKTLKIDRSVMLKAMDSEVISKFIRSVVNLSHDMGMYVVAEGIEDMRMVEMARGMDVDMLQGYYFSRPLSETDVLKYFSGTCGDTLQD